MNVILLQPLFLTLLPLAATPWLFRGRRRGGWHPWIRAAILILLIVALAKPAILTKVTHGTHVVINDGESEDVAALLESHSKSKDEMVSLALAEEESLGRALGRAALAIPEGDRGSVTLVSVGSSTRKDWGNAVHQLAERGIPIHTVVRASTDNDLYPFAVTTPSPLKVGETGRVMVDLAGNGDDVRVELVDTNSGAVLAEQNAIELRGSQRVTLEFEPGVTNFLPVEVRVSGTRDLDPKNNTFATTLAVQAPWEVLYVGGRLQEGASQLGQLVGPSIRIQRIDPTTSSTEVLEGTDLLILDDAPARLISDKWQEAISHAVVQQGMGMMMMGGNASFGPGGYHRTTLADLLPNDFVQKEEKRDPSTTLAIIIDTSGSMGGERVQLAKEVARLAVRRLLPHDKVGIVEFYGTKQWAAPIQSAANAIDIQRALNRLDAGGGTVILPAIEEAYYAMQNVQTRYKHVLILTDGGVEAGAFEPLLRKMAGKGMNVSTVLVGGDTHSEFLVNIANWGKGHFYSASNRFSIPEILLKQPSTSKIPSYRPGEHTVSARGGRGWWGNVDQNAVPILHGYVETRSKEGAEVLLETSTTKHPILSTWRYGLGRVTTLTTEPTGQGTVPWQAWEGYGPWLARILAKTAKEQRQVFDFEIDRQGYHVFVRATRLGESAVMPELHYANDWRDRIPMRRRSPGVFTAKLTVSPSEEVRLFGSVGPTWAGNPQRLVSPARADVSASNQKDPNKALQMEALAGLTGGQSMTLSELPGWTPTLGGGTESLAVIKLWLWCLALALLFYLIDILYRRLPARDPR